MVEVIKFPNLIYISKKPSDWIITFVAVIFLFSGVVGAIFYKMVTA